MEKNKVFFVDKKVNWTYIFLITILLTYYVTFIHTLERPDFDNYPILFNRISNNGSNIQSNTVNSFGFYYYIRFIKLFTDNFRFFIGFTAFLSISIKMFLLSKFSKNTYYSTFIYCLLVFPLHELIQIRIGLATSLLFLSLYFLGKKSYIKSLSILIVSFSFHFVTLALALFGLIFKSIISILTYKKIPLKINLLAFLGLFTLLIIILIRFLTLTKDINYYFEDNKTLLNIFSVRTSLLLFMTIIGFKEFKKFPETVQNYFCLSCLGIFSYYFFSNNINVASRVMQSVYFSFIIWINYMPPNLYKFLKYILLIVSLILFYLKRTWFFQ